jgi:hypothetical protein
MAHTRGTVAADWTDGVDQQHDDDINALSTKALAPGLVSGIVKANGSGTLSAATAGTDYVAPGGPLGTPSSGTATNLTGLPLAGLVSAAYNTTPTASTLAEWDANKNLSANALFSGYTTTATAAGTTTLTIASTQEQVFTGTTTQTVKLPTTSVAAGAEYVIVNQSTGAVTVQSSGANTILVLSCGQSATFFSLAATPTTAANWYFQLYGGNAASGVVQLDSFSGTDDQKLTAAMAFASAQTQIPAIQFPSRTVTLNTGGRTPYSGMRLIGPGPGASDGPKDPDISTGLTQCLVFLNVGTTTSSLFNGASGTYFNVYVGGLTFMNGNAASQFWHQPGGTLYACQFHSLCFYGMNSAFGDATNKCLVTQVNFTGHWTVIGGTGTQFHFGGSDCSFWMSGYCNFNNGGTASGTQYMMILDTFAKANLGYLYITCTGGWSGLLLEGGGSGVNFHGGTYEGLNAGSPSTAAPVTITGGDWAFFGSAFDFTTTANGIIVQSGGTVSLFGVSNNPATTSPSPLIYQTGGTAYCVAPQGAGGTTVSARWSDGNTVSLPFTPTVSNAPSVGITSTVTAAGTTTLTVTSTAIQVFTGTTTQTVKLPTTNVLAAAQYTIINNSTGTVSVQSSGANAIDTVAAGASKVFTALVATPTTAANWYG